MALGDTDHADVQVNGCVPAPSCGAAAGALPLCGGRRQASGAAWRALLPVEPGKPLLAIGLGAGELLGLAHTWRDIHVAASEDAIPSSTLQEVEGQAPGCELKRVEATALRGGTYCGVVSGPARAASPGAREVAGLLLDGGSAVWVGRRHEAPASSGLRASGFDAVRRYALLPPGTGKIMLPVGSGRMARAGLAFYAPGKRRNRLAMRLARAAARIGLQGLLARRSVVVGRKAGNVGQDAYLLEWLGRRLDEPVADVTVHDSPGKLTLQLLGADGRVLGVAKVAETDRTTESVEREGQALSRLAAVPEVRDCVPKVIAAGCWGGHAVRVQSAVLGGRRGYSRTLTDAHMKFLAALARIDRREVALTSRPRWAQLEGWVRGANFASDLEADSVRQAFDRSARALAGTALPLHRIHGDFAPWNVALCKGGLTAVDWEESEAAGLPFYDLIHFSVRVARLLAGKEPPVQELLRRTVPSLGAGREFDYLVREIWGGGACPLSAQQREALATLCVIEERMKAYESGACGQ